MHVHTTLSLCERGLANELRLKFLKTPCPCRSWGNIVPTFNRGASTNRAFLENYDGGSSAPYKKTGPVAEGVLRLLLLLQSGFAGPRRSEGQPRRVCPGLRANIIKQDGQGQHELVAEEQLLNNHRLKLRF